MDSVRIGIVGTGMMGCEHINNFRTVPGAVITAISDPNEEPRGWARITLGDRADGVAEFTDHRDLLASGLVDAVVVASPNHTHREVLGDILATDTAVLVEKPMCTTVEDCLEVVDMQSRRSAVTWVGLEYRYMPQVAEVLRHVRAGGVGDLRMVSIREHRFPFLKKVDNWNRFSRNTGGTLVEKCCHFFDLMNLAVGARPVRVMASGGQDVNHLDEWYDGERSDILDNAFVTVEYANGVRTMLDLSMFAEGSRYEQQIVAVGSTGKIEAEVPGGIWVGERSTRSVTELRADVDESVGHVGYHHGASWVECSRFLDAVRNGTTAEVGVSDGLWSVAIGAAAHRSIDEGRVVSLSEWGL